MNKECYKLYSCLRCIKPIIQTILIPLQHYVNNVAPGVQLCENAQMGTLMTIMANLFNLLNCWAHRVFKARPEIFIKIISTRYIFDLFDH
jgi:hypothetical protein